MTEVCLVNSSPSIGSLGVNVDWTNKRVKALFENNFSGEQEIISCLKDEIYAKTEATTLLAQEDARFTARVLTPRNQIEKIGPIEIFPKLFVYEEARISIGSYDLIYVGGNMVNRIDEELLAKEWEFAIEQTSSIQRPIGEVPATFHLLKELTEKDIQELLDMFKHCYNSYLVELNRELIKNAAKNSIFFVARNLEGRIVACAIGESLKLGPITLFEISEGAAHPIYRVKGAASECIRRVLAEGKRSTSNQIFAFIEARLWQNSLGNSSGVGFTQFTGILHQHCVISTPAMFNSIPQTKYGSLAVCYCPT